MTLHSRRALDFQVRSASSFFLDNTIFTDVLCIVDDIPCQMTQCLRKMIAGAPGRLQNRLLFHLAHKLNDENKLMIYHQKLTDDMEDQVQSHLQHACSSFKCTLTVRPIQLSLASIHYLRNHFQEATDIYKRLLLESRDSIALNVYVALCYYKLGTVKVPLTRPWTLVDTVFS
jgi:hypothetical protein